MLLNYKFRLCPNSDQRQALNRVLEIHRQVYNAALKERRHAWKRCGVSIRYAVQANQLKGIRSFDDDVAWCNFSSLQQTLRRLEKADSDGFCGLRGHEFSLDISVSMR
jgi:putative transposase